MISEIIGLEKLSDTTPQVIIEGVEDIKGVNINTDREVLFGNVKAAERSWILLMKNYGV